jgi:hypothetical protein
MGAGLAQMTIRTDIGQLARHEAYDMHDRGRASEIFRTKHPVHD